MDLNIGAMSHDAEGRMRPRDGGQTEEPEGDESRDQVRVPQQKTHPYPRMGFFSLLALLLYCLLASYGLTALDNTHHTFPKKPKATKR